MVRIPAELLSKSTIERMWRVLGSANVITMQHHTSTQAHAYLLVVAVVVSQRRIYGPRSKELLEQMVQHRLQDRDSQH